MEGPRAAAGGDVSLHNFSARLWEQLVHFHVMRLTDSLFLWVGATPHLRNLAVAMCNRYTRREAVRLGHLATSMN
uniref:Proteasome assembly chaperone 4 n=1 Tax=Canis lupus familiaris TaxID=9615 RepID=A0A8C0MQ21_CANLF